jgi:hypothetical protein
MADDMSALANVVRQLLTSGADAGEYSAHDSKRHRVSDATSAFTEPRNLPQVAAQP